MAVTLNKTSSCKRIMQCARINTCPNLNLFLLKRCIFFLRKLLMTKENCVSGNLFKDLNLLPSQNSTNPTEVTDNVFCLKTRVHFFWKVYHQKAGADDVGGPLFLIKQWVNISECCTAACGTACVDFCSMVYSHRFKWNVYD